MSTRKRKDLYSDSVSNDVSVRNQYAVLPIEIVDGTGVGTTAVVDTVVRGGAAVLISNRTTTTSTSTTATATLMKMASEREVMMGVDLYSDCVQGIVKHVVVFWAI